MDTYYNEYIKWTEEYSENSELSFIQDTFDYNLDYDDFDKPVDVLCNTPDISHNEPGIIYVKPEIISVKPEIIPSIKKEKKEPIDNCLPVKPRFNYEDIIFNPRQIKMKWSTDVLNLGVRDINKYIKNHNLSKQQITLLKYERRRLFNRLYARNSRGKKNNK